MKKLLLSLIVGILMLSFIAGAEFDNVKSYDPILNEVTFSNSFLGIPTTEIAKARLITPQINYVMPGKDRKVAEFDIDLTADTYNDVLKQIDLINNKDGKAIIRQINYKYKTLIPYEIDVNDYKEVCEIDAKNGSEVCVQEVIGKHKETRYNEIWTPLEKLDLVKGKITIGLFADVYPDDNVEWIPTLFGKEVSEWATWTSGMNVGLTHYWGLDETGTTATDSAGGLYGSQQDMKLFGTGAKFNTAGLIRGKVNSTGADLTYVATSGGSKWGYPNATNPFAVSLWMKSREAATGAVFSVGDSAIIGNNGIRVLNVVTKQMRVFIGGADSGNFATAMPQDGSEWIHLVVQRNETYGVQIYVNGTLKKIFQATGDINTGNFSLFEDYFAAGGDGFYGDIDEVGMWNRSLSASEVTDLYNGGVGLSYLGVITLNAPVDFYNSTSNIVEFNATISSKATNTLTNASLYTNSSGTWALDSTNALSGTSATTIFSKSFTYAGKYKWGIQVCESDGNCSWSDNRTINISVGASPAFGLCGLTADYNIPLVNYTFRDSSTLATLTAYVITSFNYSSLTNTTNVTYTYNSGSEYYSFAFCGTHHTNYTVYPTIQYASLGYPLATSTPGKSVFNNVTTNITLDLTSLAGGIYQSIYVTTGNGLAILGATVNAYNSNNTLVGTGTTDSSGFVQLFLDATVSYTLVTNATGYPSNTRYVNPSPTPIYVTLGSSPTYPSNLSITYTEGVTYTILPSAETLSNDTTYTFGFTVNHGTYDIDSFRFDVYNESNANLGSSSSSANGGSITSNINVKSSKVITLIASWTSNGTKNTVSRTWSVVNSDGTDYSLTFLASRIKTYLASGIFGLTQGFALNLFCFVVIIITTGIASYKFGLDNPIIIGIIAVSLIAIFEIGLGLISVPGVPITFWAALVLVGIGVKEALT